MNRRALVAAAGVAVGGLAGCNALPFSSTVPIDEVDVSIYDVRKPDVGLSSTTLPVLLELENPTETQIPSPEGDFDLSINGAESAKADPAFNSLSPGDSVTETIDVLIDHSELSESTVKAVASREFELQIVGELRSDGATRSIDLRYP